MCSSQMETEPKSLTKLSTIEFKKEQMEAAQKDGNNENDQHVNVLHTPYIQGFSEKLAKDLRKLGSVFVINKGETLKQNFANWNQRQEHQKDVDYIISCQICGMKHIGEQKI